MKMRTDKKEGFTIVELLIVIAVIGILAAIVTVTFTGVQDRAAVSRVETDLSLLHRAIKAARIQKSGPLKDVTNETNTAAPCGWYNLTTMQTQQTKNLTKTHQCWVQYMAAIDAIATAAGTNLDGLKNGDPWGNVYYIDENEDEGDGCSRDAIWSNGKNGVKTPPGSGANTTPSFFDTTVGDTTERSLRVDYASTRCT